MQMFVAFVALPAVALAVALASRLEDGLRAPARPHRAPLALPAGPSATPVECWTYRSPVQRSTAVRSPSRMPPR